MSDTLQLTVDADQQQHAILWKSDGVYYCRLQMAGQSSLVTLALHGISAESDARHAFKALQVRFQPDAQPQRAA